MKVTALCGGVGGAKLALGLYREVSDLSLVINTGDDFSHYGLPICPDIDTVAYTLSGKANTAQGWGREDESFAVQAELAAIGEDIWFQLGDRDIALHLLRLKMLSQGESLSNVTYRIAERLDIHCALIPMAEVAAPTMIETDEGILPFQQYFVKRRCAPTATRLDYGGRSVPASPPALHALTDEALGGIIVCPSNPLLSIGPILAIAQIRTALEQRRVPALAVSPLIGGQAVKGPTAKMMRELSIDTSAAGVAGLYVGLIDAFVLDEQDAHEADAIRALGMTPLVAPTLMTTEKEKTALARFCLEGLSGLR